MNIRENINPDMLSWARSFAGFSIDQAAQKVGFNDSKNSSAVQKLKELESGSKQPTRNQVLKFAKIYHQSPILFYVSKPPVRSENNVQFRSVASNISDEVRGRLNAMIVDIKMRQSILRTLLEDDEDVHPHKYVGALSIDDKISHCCEKIRQLLDISEDANIARKFNTAKELFNEFRDRIEHIGIFVLLSGNLGTHHTKIPESIFRGYAIADEYAPLIVINEYDAHRARLFTLIHEFMHILCGNTGISIPLKDIGNDVEHMRIERFCNDVASEFLLPTKRLDTYRWSSNLKIIEEKISSIADENHLSKPMVAYNLWRKKFISKNDFSRLHNKFNEQLLEWKELNRQKARESDGGPSYYVIRRNRLGKAILSRVKSAFESEELTATKAAKVLGINPNAVNSLLKSGS